MSQNELSAFLRAKREAVAPAAVGLPSGGRRRTPGLRRSELATLAGISVEYLTRLEQGRDRHPSGQVLGALADALRLSPADRNRLRHVAKAISGHALCTAVEPPSRSVRPAVRALLDRLEPGPAVVINRLTDVLAFTSGYAHLMAPFGLLEAEHPNLLRFLFSAPQAKAAFPDWDRVADEHVAVIKAEVTHDSRHALELVEELSVTAGARFSDRFAAATVFTESAGVERVAHPEVGDLRLAYESLELSDPGGLRLIVYLPDDDATAGALDRLTGRRPGALRAVAL